MYQDCVAATKGGEAVGVFVPACSSGVGRGPVPGVVVGMCLSEPGGESREHVTDGPTK